MLSKILLANPHCERLPASDQTWQRAIATVASILSRLSQGILYTHNPQILDLNFATLSQLWIFTPQQSCLISLANFNHLKLEVIYLNDPPTFLVYLHRDFQILLLQQPEYLLFSCHDQALTAALTHLHAPPTLPQPHLNYSSLATFTRQIWQQPTELLVPEITETDLLRALSHEVNTPLTTISTLLKSVLRRPDLIASVRDRLEQIKIECDQQITRFSLIFDLLNLSTSPLLITKIDTCQLLQELMPHWQKNALAQQLRLHLIAAPLAPAIASNPNLLKLLLNSIADRLIRTLPPGSQIQLDTAISGNYWKLRFSATSDSPPTLQQLGQWLMLQPETGRVSLSLSIAKTLFRSLHAKLSIKASYNSQNPEILTIFLPCWTD
ncbi:MAG: hypothetical protein SFT94_09975 [Pseudanabaenaceae cyanobacterium bins.68]|nr:hypothetical protein [Pseudanabaenaceae cyanobacterium bins.68]